LRSIDTLWRPRTRQNPRRTGGPAHNALSMVAGAGLNPRPSGYECSSAPQSVTICTHPIPVGRYFVCRRSRFVPPHRGMRLPVV
jgi:hypothetical protein